MKKILRVNPIKCEAYGLCAEMLPESIDLDDWGYPIIKSTELSPELEKHAQRAVAACPKLALLLEQSQEK
jgi:ferredoxin